MSRRMFGGSLRLLAVSASKESLHALGLEALYPALEGALGDSGLFGAFGHGAAEQYGLA